MTGHEYYDDLVAAHALDALDAEERRAFEAHLATCDACSRALADLRRVSAGIALSVDPVEPPASLRERTLARATAQPQDGRPVQPGDGRTPLSFAPRPLRAAPSPILTFALAASLIGLVGVSVYAWVLRTELVATRESVSAMGQRMDTLRTQLMTTRTEAARLMNTIGVLRSTDLVRVDLRGQGSAPGATGHAFVSQATGLVLRADNLPRLAANRTYQLWVVPPGAGAAPISAGVFDPDASGSLDITIQLPSGVQVVRAVALTEEPAGGSIKATTAPLLIGAAN
ncbi:MAG: anti-sigma factor [Acidobacteriota bacterium]